MSKKTIVRVLAILLAVSMIAITATVSFAADGDPQSGTSAAKYAKPDINELTGHGKEPEELSVSAGATYQEKKWYEYVTYSDKAVASYRLNDDSRLLFYDPYTYTNAMVMDVQFDATTTEFDTMSSYEISKTTSKTIASDLITTYTTTDATQRSGKDEMGSTVDNSGTIKTTYNHTVDASNYGYSKNITETNSLSDKIVSSLGSEIGTEAFGVVAKVKADLTAEIGTGLSISESTLIHHDGTITSFDGDDTVEDTTKSETKGWSQLSDRVTITTGSSRSISNSWSETESTTVTKTYAATHFAADGVTPLPWAIVHYTVQMPMKCCVQYKYEGEWVTISTVYCMLTTIKGTCRTWMQNSQAYYEDWGSGEPVVATDFWAQFMTKDQLMNAYQHKLYPMGGED